MHELSTTVRHDVDRDVTVVTVRGVLDLNTAVAMRTTLAKCIAECPSAVIADVSACTADGLGSVTVFPTAARKQALQPIVALLLADSTGRFLDRSRRAALGQVPAYPDIETAWAAADVARASLTRVRLGFRRSPAAANQARDVVGAACELWGTEELTLDAKLVVSELVTNAIKRARTEAILEAVLRGSFLHLRVRDGSSAPPVPVHDPGAGPGI